MVHLKRTAIAIAIALFCLGWTRPALAADEITLGAVTFRPIARAFIDAGLIRHDDRTTANARLTTFRLGGSGSIGGSKGIDYFMLWELRDLFGNPQPEARLRYALVHVGIDKHTYLEVGQNDQPFALEGMATTKMMSFMEFGLPLALEPLYHFGAVVSRHHDNWGAAFGVFSGTLGQRYHDSGKGWSGRAFASPIKNGPNLLHVGASYGERDPDGQLYRLFLRPEAFIYDHPLVDTGLIRDVRALKPIGVEAAWVRGPLSVQGEFVRLNMTRHAPAADLSFDGGYVYVAYSLTGEQRPYDGGRGAFYSIRPRGKTAVELLARVSWLDLDDKTVRGGKEVNFTAGLNWYLNPHARMMFNAIAADSKRGGRERNLLVGQARLQLDW